MSKRMHEEHMASGVYNATYFSCHGPNNKHAIVRLTVEKQNLRRPSQVVRSFLLWQIY